MREKLGTNKTVIVVCCIAFLLMSGCRNDDSKVFLQKESVMVEMADDVSEGDFRIVDICGTPYLRSCISFFNAEQSEYKLGYEAVSESAMKQEEDTFWTRTMAQMVSGDMPDLFCIPAGDEKVKALYEKGLLADLNDYVSEEVKRNIFPGVIQSGTIDQTWVGLGVSAMPYVMFVSDSIWPSSHWTIDDIIQIEKEHADLEGLFLWHGKGTPSWNASCLFMDPYYFVDEKTGITDFKGSTFQEALTMLKKYGEKSVYDKYISTSLQEGKYLANTCIMVKPEVVIDALNDYYSHDCHMVGDVGQTDGIGHWESIWLILVNKDTKHPDEVKKFLSYLSDFEIEHPDYASVCTREDIIRNKVEYWENSGTYTYRLKDNVYIDFTKKDGESYLEDYVSMLRNLGSCVSNDDPVKTIVLEEIKNYYDSEIPVEKISDIVDSRVQIFIRESGIGMTKE